MLKEIFDLDLRPTGSKFVTYESVLLTPDRNKLSHFSNPKNTQNTTSYAYIDIMLERMLDEVEKQEKIFGLDLDILEPNETCINSLELLPSSDAIIEIPIKNSIQKPTVYQCVREMVINDETDGDNKQTKSEENVDLIDFESTNKENELEKISLATANLITSLETDEAKMLLDDELQIDAIDKRKYDMYFVRRASSESLSDNYPDSESDTNEHLIDPDYELIDNTTPLKYAYQLYDNRTGNDIWWEGTYRNLSIVPEEDEESVSLLGSYSGNYISKPFITRKSPTLANNSLLIKETLRSSSSSTSTSSLSSSDEGHYETFEKVVKAEVKLMVKTVDKGKEAIEIRSVREFVENPKKDIPLKESKSKSKSQFLPQKISKKINNISNRFSSMLESKGKKSSEYAVLQNPNVNKQKGSTAKQKNPKPSFTLPRLFVRTEQEPIKPSKSESDLLNNKELSRSRSELVATPSETFPLQLYPNTFNYFETSDLDENKVDLYANRPFYPCYNQYTVKPTLFQTNPFTEFTSNPFTCNSPIPQAYCDWLSEQEDISRGKVVFIFAD